jgi:chlorite dismutase
MNRRLFMQLLVYEVDGQPDEQAHQVAARLRGDRVASVVYADTQDPRSLGILTWSEDPAHFVMRVRPHLQVRPCARAATTR